METAIDLFRHELRDMLNAESRLVQALKELESESKDEQVRAAFGEHRQQTEHHAKRLMDIFRMLGEEPEQSDCKGIAGLIEEKQAFMKEHPSQPLIEFYNVWAGIKAERYEIATYRGLISMAGQLGLTNSRELLEKTLAEEEGALRKLQGFVGRVFPIKTGIEYEGQQLERKIA